MKSRRQKHGHPMVAAAIVERFDNHLLIALPSLDDPKREWQFPRVRVEEDESPESGVRRCCRHQLGLTVEVVVGQPPLRFEIDGDECDVRYFFCGVVSGEPTPGPNAEVRWVPRGHLREYEFDAVSRPIAEWLLEEGT